MRSLAELRGHLTGLLHLQESPHRTALAFAVGAFIAFSPAYGLHTLSVLLCIWAFRLNGVALLAGSLINNPWTLIPILGATLWTGGQLAGGPVVPALHGSTLNAVPLYEQIAPGALPFLLGGFTLSLLGALISYPAAYWLITTHRARRHGTGAGELPPGPDVG